MSRSRHLSTRFRITAFIVVLSLVTGLSALTTGGRPAAAAPLHAVPSLSVMVPAGGSATISVRAVALTPGAALPAGPLALAQEPPAPARLRTAVYYGIDWGYADTAPAQVALALWHVQDGVWRSEDHTVAERISAAALTAQGTPSWLPDGSSVLQAAAGGQVALSELTLTPLLESASVGNGTLTVTNMGFADALLYLPYGTVFSGPNGSVIAWAAPALPGAQSSPTVQPVEPTATAEVLPSATPTPEPPFASDPPVKGDYATATPVIEPTATAGSQKSTSTPAPPTESPSPEPPTATATATATPEPTETQSPEPTSTATAPAQPEEQSTARQAPGSAPAVPAVAPDPKVVAGQAEDQEQEGAPEAPLPPPSDATETPGTSQSAPAPVSTSAAAGAPMPQPVSTQPGATIPPPVQTVVGTPPGSQVPPPVASRQPTSQVRVTPSPSPTVEEVAEPTATSAPAAEPTVEVPTPAPTPVPVPPTPDEASGEGPVINVAPGATTPEPSGGAVEPSAGESASQMPQTYNPNTGGGGSMVPLWLGMLSAVMVLGGWSLRRVSRPAPVRVRREDDAE
ncbi:MAG TPA: hypothetical protein VFR15_07525 [Chloroflexia bacterium]|nr:hypothetical protein [Chloroflexia bacterium]